MIGSLQPLTRLIENLAQLTAAERSERLSAIVVTCADSLVDALSIHHQYNHADLASRAVQLYHTQLLRLHDILYAYCDPSIAEEGLALNSLEELLDRIESLFKKDIDPNTALPQHHMHRIRQYVDSHLPDILQRLAQKEIPQVYLDELHSALQSLFEPSKIPYIQYHHLHYLVQLIDALRQLAYDQRQHKNWQYRFLVLMITFNFNHMGFFNRWKENYQNDPVLMENLLRFPQQFSHIPAYAYDPNRNALLTLMCQYIEMAEFAPLQGGLAELFIHSNLNGKELKIFLHLLVKAKVTKSPEKKEAAKEFSKLVKTKEGILVSEHSLIKMDRNSEYPAAVHIYRSLKSMQTELLERFPDLKR